MRTIKFRAIKKLGLDEEPAFFTLDDLMSRKIVFDYPEHWNFSEWTGLLDKNGKEIYEGDILRSEYKNFGDENPHQCHPVVWREGQWIVDHSIQDCCKAWRGNLNGHHQSEEIIGNVLENPELIEKKI